MNQNYNSFKDWMTNHFSNKELADIANFGCASGFHGLIYYSETTTLYQQYKDDIWELVTDATELYGYKSSMEFLASLHGSLIDDADQFENLLVWFAAEQIAWQITDAVYDAN